MKSHTASCHAQGRPGATYRNVPPHSPRIRVVQDALQRVDIF